MPRDYRSYLDDIMEAIGSIREYAAGMDYETFSRDRKTQDAVVRNLEVIGEAAGRIPELVLAAAPEIEWRKVIGMRNILIHEYFGISLPIIWNVVETKLDQLETSCRTLLETAPNLGKEVE